VVTSQNTISPRIVARFLNLKATPELTVIIIKKAGGQAGRNGGCKGEELLR